MSTLCARLVSLVTQRIWSGGEQQMVTLRGGQPDRLEGHRP
jgi:hypothetical protein